MERRTFIKSAAIATPMLSVFPAGLSVINREENKGKLEKRKLGKTGKKLSIIGFGGIVVNGASPEQASERVKEAISYGVNYFDVAPTYGDAEIKLGPALEPYRKNIFLSCKTTERTMDGAAKELEQSLQRLRTDHFDLYQLHSMSLMQDVDTVFGPNGAMKTFLKAKEEGKIRFIGFSAHTVEAAMELMRRFDFDTIMFPINFATWHAGNFGPQVLEMAKSKNMGIIALKAMAKRPWMKGAERNIKKVWYEPLLTPQEAQMGIRFTLSHPVTTAIPPGNEDLFSLALKLAVNFKALSDSEVLDIKKKGLETEPLFRYSG